MYIGETIWLVFNNVGSDLGQRSARRKIGRVSNMAKEIIKLKGPPEQQKPSN